MNKKVLIATEKPFAEQVRNSIVAEMEGAGLTVSVLENYTDKADLLKAVADVNGIIIRSDKITEEVMSAAKDLQLVVRAGSGFDNVDIAFAQENGVVVENTPGQNANAVAELALELMLAAVRPLNGKSGRELKDRTLAVHGFGNIGRLVAGLGRSFGMAVKVFDMYIDASAVRNLGVTVADSVEDLYADADVVSVHIPDNASTHGSINSKLLLSMKPDGVLVNTARAGVINEDDMLAVFKQNTDFRYATDVAPSDDFLASIKDEFIDNIVMTPKKQGAQTLEANINAGMAAANQSISYFKDGDTTFCVYKLIPPHLKDYTKLAVQLGKLNAAFVPKPREINVIAYGELDGLADTLAEYVLKGLFCSALGCDCTPHEAAQYAKDRSIKVIKVKPDNMRGYGNALTVDFIIDDEQHSSRGRIDEGEMEASRIGEFKARMPLDSGIYVITTYKERVGMTNQVGQLLIDAGYNRVILGAGPNMDNSKAQAFFEVVKPEMSFEDQLVELSGICAEMAKIKDVYEVKLINLLA